jgi:transposase
VQRMLCRIKNWRRIATRYDRLADNCTAAVALVAIVCFRCGLSRDSSLELAIA